MNVNNNVVCFFFLQCCITLGPAHEFSLQGVKLSRKVIYRYKVIRIKCSFNWSCINYEEMHCGSGDSSLVSFYKCKSSDWARILRIPFLDNIFWISLGSFFPLPLPRHSFFFFFCSCPSFLDEPRQETLAPQARISLTVFELFCYCHFVIVNKQAASFCHKKKVLLLFHPTAR